MNRTKAVLAGVLVAACILGCQASAGPGGDSVVETPTPVSLGSNPEIAPTGAGQMVVDGASGGWTSDSPDAALFREMAFAYWDAFNAYDIDAVLSFLEPVYRSHREEQVRSDLGRLKQFRVKLGVSEHISPVIGESGDWEMYLLMKEPLGLRVLRMAYQKSRDKWYISHAEEVK